MDIPWVEVMKPVLDRVPDLEKVISTKIFKEFPEHLIHLQKEIIELGFSSNYMNNSRPNFKRKYKGVILRILNLGDDLIHI